VMDLFQLLSDRRSYDSVYDKLRKKAEAEPHKLHSAPVEGDISLRWLLLAQDKIVRYLVREIRAKRYFPGECNLNLLMLDKPRELFSLAWPDRIVEALVAQTLQQLFEPRFSTALYSFRKGRNNLMAVRRAAQWIADRRFEGRRIFVAKRDIAKFGESIDPLQVVSLLQRELSEQQPYIWELLQCFLSPRYRKDGLSHPPRPQGLPTGFALTPICENLLLNRLDHSLAEEPGLLYLRFGDDMLLLHNDPQVLRAKVALIERALLDFNLQFNSEKSLDIELCELSPTSAVEQLFSPKQCFDYLGFRVDSTGKIWLSNRKQLELKKELRHLARRSFYAARQVEAKPEGVISAMVYNMNLALDRHLAHAYLGLALATTTDLGALKNLDRWIAKQVLSFVYGSTQDRVFRYRSLRTLRRDDGLRSLVHMQKSRFRPQGGMKRGDNEL